MGGIHKKVYEVDLQIRMCMHLVWSVVIVYWTILNDIWARSVTVFHLNFPHDLSNIVEDYEYGPIVVNDRSRTNQSARVFHNIGPIFNRNQSVFPHWFSFCTMLLR